MNNYYSIDPCTLNQLYSVIQVELELGLSKLVISYRNISNPNLMAEYLFDSIFSKQALDERL